MSQRKLFSTFLWIGCATSLLVLPGFSHVTVVLTGELAEAKGFKMVLT